MAEGEVVLEEVFPSTADDHQQFESGNIRPIDGISKAPALVIPSPQKAVPYHNFFGGPVIEATATPEEALEIR
jgi:hypothetical protein